MTKQDRINELEAELDGFKAMLEVTHQWMTNIERHLLSPKFYEDTTIQTADVFHFIRNLRGAIIDEGMEPRGLAHPIKKDWRTHPNCW